MVRALVVAVLCFAWMLANSPESDAATIYRGFDAPLVGGAGGIFGNGLVFATPVYTFGLGDTVDFGLATVRADPPDGRGGSCTPPYNTPFTNNCLGNGGYTAFTYGPDDVPAPINPFGIYGADLILCRPDSDCSKTYRIVVALAPNKSRIQLVFQGSGVSNIAAVPIAPAVWFLVSSIAVLLAFGSVTQSRSVTAVSPQE
jgi:hypothetical protein